MQPSPVLTSVIDVELPAWIVVPGSAAATPEWRAGVEHVFATITQVERDLPGDEQVFADGRELDAAAAVERLVAMADDLDEGDRLVAGLAVPHRWPLPVIVSVGAADPDTDLLDLAGATGGLPVDRPTVEPLPTEDGAVVTRFDMDDDGAIRATVCGARRTGGVDTRVMWRTSDLPVVPAFTPWIVELVAAVRNEVTA